MKTIFKQPRSIALFIFLHFFSLALGLSNMACQNKKNINIQSPSAQVSSKLPPPESSPSPGPTPSPEPNAFYTRITCEAENTPTNRFPSLRSDASERMIIPSFSLLTGRNAKEFSFIQNPELLMANKSTLDIVAEAKDETGTHVVRALVSIADRIGSATEIYSYPNFTSNTSLSLATEGLKARNTLLFNGLNNIPTLQKKIFWIAAPTSNLQAYEVHDLVTSKTLATWPLSALNYSPAAFSDDGRSLAFYGIDSANALTLTIANLDSQTLASLPSAPAGFKQLAPTFSGSDTIYWLEKGSEKTLLRAQKLSQAMNSVTLSTRSQKVTALEVIRNDQTDLLAFIEDDKLYLAPVNHGQLSLKPEDIQPIPFADSMAASLGSATKPFLNSLQYGVWTKQLFMSLGNNGGLLSYNIETKNWNIHGVILNPFKCLYPNLGPQIMTEEVINEKN